MKEVMYVKAGKIGKVPQTAMFYLSVQDVHENKPECQVLEEQISSS